MHGAHVSPVAASRCLVTLCSLSHRSQQLVQKEKMLKEEVEEMKATLSCTEEGRARASAHSKHVVSPGAPERSRSAASLLNGTCGVTDASVFSGHSHGSTIGSQPRLCSLCVCV